MSTPGCGWRRRCAVGVAALTAVITVMTACGRSSERGWLASDDSRVIYATWTDRNGSLIGDGRMLELVEGIPDPYTVTDQLLRVGGTKRGATIDLSVGIGATEVRWTGRVKGDTVRLSIPGPAGVQTYDFRRASAKAYKEAANELRQ